MKRPRRRGGAYSGNPLASSALDRETGEDSAGDDTVSSKSDRKPSSSDAAKLVDISGSDIKAKEDCVDAVDVVEVVRSLAESRDADARGSSCHSECATSIGPYRRP